MDVNTCSQFDVQRVYSDNNCSSLPLHLESHLDTVQAMYVYIEEHMKRLGDIQYEVDATHGQEDSIESAPTPAVDDFVNEEEQTGDIEDIKI